MRIILILIFVLAVVQPVSADIYKYIDANGVMIFTDNLADVPVDQREGVEQFEEIRSAPSAPSASGAQSKGRQAQTAPKNSGLSSTDPNTENLTEHQKLKAEKQILDTEYENLVRQRQALKKNKPEFKDSAQLESYRRKVMALNERIKAFDGKRRAFEKKVAAFNLKNSLSAE